MLNSYKDKQGNQAIQIMVIAFRVKKQVKIHMARHTFTMLCMNNDINIYTTSKLLGNNLANTQIYARISYELIQSGVLKEPGWDKRMLKLFFSQEQAYTMQPTMEKTVKGGILEYREFEIFKIAFL